VFILNPRISHILREQKFINIISREKCLVKLIGILMKNDSEFWLHLIRNLIEITKVQNFLIRILVDLIRILNRFSLEFHLI